MPEFSLYCFSKQLKSLVIFLERLAAARGDVRVFVAIKDIAMDLSDNIICVNLFLTEIVEYILLCELASHEYCDSVKVITFFILKLFWISNRSNPPI